MRVDEYAAHDAVGLRDLLRAGDVSEAEVEAAAREAIGAVDGTLNALAMPLFDAPLDHAADGPFAGVPFLIKNSGPVEGAVCPHGAGPPSCWCRPPLPRLILEFARRHDVDPARSTLIGTSAAHRTLATTLGARFVEVS